jgi:membrane associated rhomboid family serine protease
MIHRIIDDLKDSTSTTLREASLMAVAGIALLIAVGFLCAAGFIFVLHKWGAIAACIAGAVLFIIVTLIVFLTSVVIKRQYQARVRQRAKAARNLLADPALLMAGLKAVQTLGVKRMIPLVALGGLALGLLASRSAAHDEAAGQAPAE